jgi:hypothetical protein
VEERLANAKLTSTSTVEPTTSYTKNTVVELINTDAFFFSLFDRSLLSFSLSGYYLNTNRDYQRSRKSNNHVSETAPYSTSYELPLRDVLLEGVIYWLGRLILCYSRGNL